MNAKIQIPCEIKNGLTFTTIYVVTGKRVSDGSLFDIEFYLNYSNALKSLEFGKEYYSKLYSDCFISERVLCL